MEKVKGKVVQCHLGVKSTTSYPIMLLETGRTIEPLKLPQQGHMGNQILTTEKTQWQMSFIHLSYNIQKWFAG